MISGCFIAHNEEKNIEDFLKNVQPFLDEIILVDSHSQDNTVKIAQEKGCRVFLREFDNFSSIRNFCLEKASYPWRFNIDLDERISQKFQEIADGLTKDDRYDGYSVRINHYRSDDNKLIDVCLKKVLFKSYGIYWGDIHERIITLKHEMKIDDKDVYVYESKSLEHQYKIFQKYKQMLLSLYKDYKSKNQILLMNRVTECLMPEHNKNLTKWIDDLEKRKDVTIYPEEFI